MNESEGMCSSSNDSQTDNTSLTQKDSQFSQSLRAHNVEKENIEKNRYAVLCAMDEALNSITLYSEYFGFGRNPEHFHYCDFHQLSSTKELYVAISAQHCYIHREFSSKRTYLYDTSKYGTFVNSTEIGRGKRTLLNSGDLISVGDPNFFVFMYIEGNQQEVDYPRELIDRYFISNHLIGEGAMGKVYIGKCKVEMSEAVAIKVIQKKLLSIGSSEKNSNASHSSEVTKREVDVMLNISHPNCIKLRYVCESQRMMYIVMEYVEGGELFSRIADEENDGKGLGETLTKYYGWQLLCALQYLHVNSIVHRDIKPENVLLLKKSTYTIAKLSDFGLSKMGNRSMETFCGTQSYMAPELWPDDRRYSSKIDIWALGAVLFVCICGYPAFSPDYGDMPLKEQIMKGRLMFCRIWKKISTDAQNLIRRMLRVDPSQRFCADEALKDSWFNDDVVEKARCAVESHKADQDRRTLVCQGISANCESL